MLERTQKDSPATAGWLMLAAGVNGLIAVALGAYGAHGLAADPAALNAYRTAAQYHLIHAAALAGLAAMAHRAPLLIGRAGLAFLAGIVLFCGSLYFMGFTGSRALVLVTPFGGLSFMAGWLILALTGWRVMKT